MKLFELRDWNLILSEETYGLIPFKKIIDADKSKDKELALKELLYLWFFIDVKSDYMYLTDEKERSSEIIKDVGLDKNWKVSKNLQEAIEFYDKMSTTVSSVILKNSLYMANTISNKTKTLVEQDNLSISDIEKVGKSLNQMPGIVAALQKLENSVVKEQAEQSSKIGSQNKAMFEDGL